MKKVILIADRVGKATFKLGTPLGDYMARVLEPVQPPAGSGLPCCPHQLISDDSNVRVEGDEGLMRMSGTEALWLDIDDLVPMWRCHKCLMNRLKDRVPDDVCRLCGRRQEVFSEFIVHFHANIMITGNACAQCNDRMYVALWRPPRRRCWWRACRRS